MATAASIVACWRSQYAWASTGGGMISVEREPGLGETVHDALVELGELDVAADQRAPAAPEVGLLPQELGDLALRLRPAAEQAEARPPASAARQKKVESLNRSATS